MAANATVSGTVFRFMFFLLILPSASSRRPQVAGIGDELAKAIRRDGQDRFQGSGGDRRNRGKVRQASERAAPSAVRVDVLLG
jgi:hypothetical protein